MDLLYTLDIIGTFVFAISGTLAAADKKLDLFGAAVIGFITAVGGGTVRDLLLDLNPIAWLVDPNYTIAIIAGVITTYLFKKHVLKLRKTLFMFDAIGIGVFTILGIEKSLSVEILPFFSIIMGVISSVVGGVIRDTLCNEIPLIFRKEVYATACLVGGLVFFMMQYVGLAENWNYLISIAVIICIRVVSVKWTISLPTLK